MMDWGTGTIMQGWGMKATRAMGLSDGRGQKNRETAVGYMIRQAWASTA